MEANDLVAHVIPLPREVPTLLGLGAFLKNTICVTRGDEALLSHDVGNLDSPETIVAFEETVQALLHITGQKPVAVAHDLHPDFYSTRYGAGLGIPAIPVQHHHAHVAAVMAEHGHQGPVLGLALDGFGLGPGSESWGGELLYVNTQGYRRLGHLALLKQPGADVAARQPWRMAAAALHALGRGGEIAQRFAAFKGADIIATMLAGDVNSPPTSSCGRLFDAACGLLGVVPVARFEGEAPLRLESLVRRPRVDPAGWRMEGGILDLTPLLGRLSGMEAGDGADLFHGTLAAALSQWAEWAAAETGTRDVVLCGGCLLNKVLLAGLTGEFAQRRLTPLPAINVTPGDGAISLGQVWSMALAESLEGGVPIRSRQTPTTYGANDAPR